MDPSIESWSKQDFLAFFLVCAANADAEITEDELEWIWHTIGRDSYGKVMKVFTMQSDYANLQTILHLKGRFFPGADGTDELDSYLTELFQADGNYSQIEHIFKSALDRLL
ncbi:MAG: hypothetical protein KDC43_25920 [Saprospiraceae bacterium]|nr:hypothetical protein [Saprospiraceae bacterium]MCB0627258.1 hypothetical protein [Saprospiraceae bacterium]MCB0677783.1 hypothetical protein [Saprospiraceae bacterium]MCB0683335.1 hypothetical protein [Saprospiraceae bacterium]